MDLDFCKPKFSEDVTVITGDQRTDRGLGDTRMGVVASGIGEIRP